MRQAAAYVTLHVEVCLTRDLILSVSASEKERQNWSSLESRNNKHVNSTTSSLTIRIQTPHPRCSFSHTAIMTYKRTRLDGGYDGKEQTVKRRALSSGSSFSNSPVSIYQDSSSNTRETSNGIDRLSDDLDLLDPLGSSSSPLTPSSVTSPINYESSSIKSSVSGDVATRPEFCFGMVSSSVDAL